MKIKFDTLDDARAKLLGTFCYYKGKAVYVKALDPAGDDWSMLVYDVGGTAGSRQQVLVSDKDFQASEFRIGYANFSNAAVFYYRIPARQYRQGLKAEQVGVSMSNPNWRHEIQFSSNRSIKDMMEGNYPTLEDAKKRITDELTEVMAFHKDFAISRNRIHNDFIVEYKGTQVGHTTGKNDFTLMPQFAHLSEALKEAAG